MKRATSPRGRVRRRWRSRPLLSLALRTAAILVPSAGGAAVAVGIGRAVPEPKGPPLVAWWLGLLLTCVVASVLIERLARRFLPLAMLLRLSLAFPDRAPSRFALARRYGSPRVLEERIRTARERGVDDDPARAAGEILSLVAALSAHDRKTRGHSERVRAFTDLIASELKLTEDERDHLRWAALLHDIGKLRVPARILNKPGRPEQAEWELLKGHPRAGAQIAKPLLPWLGEWGATIEQHHERFDGGGYPFGIARNDICLGARIVSVADSFEVMTAARSYKRPTSVPAARAELARCAGLQFDPDVVRAFFSISIGRLWWTVGPAAWVAVTPFLGSMQRAGGQVAAAARGVAVVAVVGLSGAVGFPATTQARGVTGQALPVTSVGVGSPTSEPSASPAHSGPGRAKPGGGSGGGDQSGGNPPGGAGGGSGGGTPGSGTGGPVSDVVATISKVIDQATGTVSDAASGARDIVVDATKDATGGLVP